jgi:hypothetical protein
MELTSELLCRQLHIAATVKLLCTVDAVCEAELLWFFSATVL